MAGATQEVSTVLGLSADYHDAAAAVLVDGEVVAAAEEERFTRVKHDPSMPRHATRFCLDAAGIGPEGPDLVCFYDKPLTKYERHLVTHALAGPRGASALGRGVASFTRRKLWVGYRVERMLRDLGVERTPVVRYAEHHQSHAAAAYLPSPFEEAAILTFDGVGEWVSSSVAHGVGGSITPVAEQDFPDSIGMLYSAITAFCGFEVNDGEYKLMGLAPYGRPRYVDVLREHVVHVADDGSIRLDQRWFDFRAGRRMTAPRLARLLDGPPRRPDEPLAEREADLAASLQVVLEDIVLRTARWAHERTGASAVCLAGGVALNCVANARLLRDGPFDEVWVQPAAGDGGGALGAALWAWHVLEGAPRPAPTGDAMAGCALGPAYGHEEVEAWLRSTEIAFSTAESEPALAHQVADRLAAGDVVGWFQGPMELGPRALGHRSILADPRDPSMIRTINQRTKGREGFRPFAPAVLAERAADWFDVDRELPYMLFTAQVGADRLRPVDEPPAGDFAARLHAERSQIPACTHVDGSARVQTVDADRNPGFHALLRAFEDRTGCPVLLNTSFNRRDEPIVRTPADALRCAAVAGLDLLVLERCTVERAALAALVP